ncbi:MAG: hypothetical protein ACLTDX_07810 [[Clostridium] innocuum]
MVRQDRRVHAGPCAGAGDRRAMLIGPTGPTGAPGVTGPTGKHRTNRLRWKRWTDGSDRCIPA